MAGPCTTPSVEQSGYSSIQGPLVDWYVTIAKLQSTPVRARAEVPDSGPQQSSAGAKTTADALDRLDGEDISLRDSMRRREGMLRRHKPARAPWAAQGLGTWARYVVPSATVVCRMPAKLWPRHLDSRGSTADCRTTTTAAEAAPAIEAYLDPRVHCLAPHGIFSRCDIAVTEQMRLMAALLRSRDMAGSLSSAGSSWQGLEIRDWRRLGLAHGFRVVEGVPICCFPIVQMGDDPCEAEWHRPATAIRALGGPSHALEIAAAATATTAPRHRRVQTLQTLFHTYGAAHPHGRMDLVQRNRFSDASRCLGSATTLEVDGHENRVLSAERPNDGLKR